MEEKLDRKKELISNTLILSLGNFLPQLTAFITLPIYTGMLSTEEYGRYDLINMVVYILGIVLLVQIQQAVFRFLIDVRGTSEQDNYITTAYVFELIPAIVASLCFGTFYAEMKFPIPFLLGYYLFITLQYNIDGQVARGIGNNRVYAIGSIIQAVLNMILIVVLMSGLEFGFVGLFLSLDIAYTIACFYQFWASKQWNFIKIEKFNLVTLKKMLAYSWPMVPNSLSIWIVNTCDKFFIRFFMGIRYNGIFAVAQKIPNIFTMAYSTFNMAWQESASITENDSDTDQYYSEIFNALFNFLSGCMLILIAATPFMFAILVCGDYEGAYDQIPILYIGVFLSGISSFFGGIYVAKKASKAVGVSSFIGAIVNCIVNFAMIRWAGLYAASVSTVVSYFALVLYRVIDVEKKRYANIRYNIKRIYVCSVLITVSVWLCYQRNIVLNVVNCAISLLSFLWLNLSLLRRSYLSLIVKLKGRKTNE